MQYIAPNIDPGSFEITTLSNGIHIFYRPALQTFGLPNIACSVVVTAGGRDDRPGREGAAHFFEHMPFRGTKRYPNLRALTYLIESNGGYINAFTTDEATGYEVIVPSEFIEEGIKRMADMLLQPLLREPDIETERQIISEELRNKLANVNFYARQELYKGLLGDHPLVHAVIGSEASLMSIHKEDLLSFHSKYYNASNLSLFFAGSYDSESLIKLCERHFGNITVGEPTKRNVFVPPRAPEKNTVILTPKRYNRSVYALGRILPPASLKETLINRLFRDMLVRGMNSPLLEEIREKRGLAYNIGLSHNLYQDVGLLIFSVSTQFKNMDEVEAIFWRVIPDILKNQQRFDEVKYMLKQSVLHREYSVGSLVDGAIDSYLDYNRIISVDEFITVLDSISLEETEAFISDYLSQDDYLAIRIHAEE